MRLREQRVQLRAQVPRQRRAALHVAEASEPHEQLAHDGLRVVVRERPLIRIHRLHDDSAKPGRRDEQLLELAGALQKCAQPLGRYRSGSAPPS